MIDLRTNLIYNVMLSKSIPLFIIFSLWVASKLPIILADCHTIGVNTGHIFVLLYVVSLNSDIITKDEFWKR